MDWPGTILIRVTDLGDGIIIGAIIKTLYEKYFNSYYCRECGNSGYLVFGY